MNETTIYNGTQAVQRAVTVLKAFGPDSAPLTPQELSRRTRINRSTVYRILSALEREGFVVADATGRYRLGPELVALGGLALRQIDLRAVALPAMRELAAHSGETIDLEVLYGALVMVVEEVSGDHLLSASSNIGQVYPAHCTATGKVLLAHAAHTAIEPLLRAESSAGGPRAIRDAAVLREALHMVRLRGYATSYEELEAHLHAIGAPIFDHRGQVVAALSISGPAARLPREQEAVFAQRIIATCAAISTQLGYRPQTGARSSEC